jgi:hypothetical protein
MAKSSEGGGFSEKTRRELADRAGHHCSLCLALTTCSDEEGKPFRIGDAAHQAAASESGPRYDPDQTDNERSSVENGLWLCSSCHRKIDGDKYRYTVEDLRQMKIDAEERACKMVHGEIVFEMKDKEDAAIKRYLDSHPLENLLADYAEKEDDPRLLNGAMLGIQVIPYRAVFEAPRLGYRELLTAGVALTRYGIYRMPTSDGRGVFARDTLEVSRIEKDATAQFWQNYPCHDVYPRFLPYLLFVEQFLRYTYFTRRILARHGIHDPRVIIRLRLENVFDKVLVHSDWGTMGLPPLRVQILETDYVVCDRGEDHKALEELWYGAGATGLPQKVLDHSAQIESQIRQWELLNPGA